ncbi:MFS transporter [Mesonia sp. MT50]|uniref:MFS transporter n=1 Tax=Mesonia profundi TaxID=3070998 RepID=A0ABU1A3P3_9FLAO|nr:MFS transporter [Mesonia profundi]MDQ7918301.1 MFS transporter [Mesonia profundi]
MIKNVASSTEAISEPRKAQKGTARYNRIKWAIFLAGISVFAQLYDFQALLGSVSDEFGKTPSQSSYLVSASTFGMAFGLLIFAFIADNFNRKNIMVFSLLSSTALTLMTPLIMNFEVLVGLNFLKGAFVSGVSAVTLAYLSEEVDKSSLGTAISFYLAGNTFGGMFGRVTTALLEGWFNWKISVLFIGVLGLVSALFFIRVFPHSRFFEPVRIPVKIKLSRMGKMLTNLNLLGIYIIAFCIMGSFVSVYNYLGFELKAPPYNLPHYLIAAIFLMYAFGIIGNLVAGSLSDKYSSKRIIRLALLAFILGIALMFSSNLILLLLGLTIFTIAFFSAHTVAGRLVTELTEKGKSMATSLYWLFYYVGSSLIGTSTGVFVNNGAWTSFFGVLLGLGVLSYFICLYSTCKL